MACLLRAGARQALRVWLYGRRGLEMLQPGSLFIAHATHWLQQHIGQRCKACLLRAGGRRALRVQVDAEQASLMLWPMSLLLHCLCQTWSAAIHLSALRGITHDSNGLAVCLAASRDAPAQGDLHCLCSTCFAATHWPNVATHVNYVLEGGEL